MNTIAAADYTTSSLNRVENSRWSRIQPGRVDRGADASVGIFSGQFGRKLLTSLMAFMLLLVTSPAPAAFAMPSMPTPPDNLIPKPDTKPVHVHTGPHKLQKVSATFDFSAHPTDLEIENIRVFAEPLVPMTKSAVTGENEALVQAVVAYKDRSDTEDLSALSSFIKKFPNSRWLPALELNIGLSKFYAGHLEDAIALWQSSWNAAKAESGREQMAIANRAVARLLLTNARLGRTPELEKLLGEVDKRSFFGADEPMVKQAREGLWLMQNKVECAFKCGPYSLDAIMSRNKPAALRSKVVENATSTKQGTNLAQVKSLADKLGMKYQMAKRTKGASIVVPSVMHWRVGHFAAVCSTSNGNYILKDTTFDTDATIGLRSATIDEESDGYFLIPEGPLPVGWQSVGLAEAQTVWGRGSANGCNNGSHNQTDPPACCSNCGDICCPRKGMAGANAWLMNASACIQDSPLSYTNPLDTIDFHLTFNQNEINQPGTFTFSNLGLNWRFNWLSYLTVAAGTNVVTLRRGDGGSLVYTPTGTSGSLYLYGPDVRTQGTLVEVSSSNYKVQMRDGSIAVYNLTDGTNFYMTQLIDPQGNSTLIQYDANYRITSITDAINQVSTLTYVSNTFGNSGFYKIAGIQDPFARSCSFTYDSTNTVLVSITDVVGNVSKFNYDQGSSFITSMNTPYGTTSFYQYIPAGGSPGALGLRVTLADSSSIVVENTSGIDKNTHFWDREATSLYPEDPANQIYTHCVTYQWTFNNSTSLEEPVPQNITYPLESASPLYFQYPGQAGDQDNYPSLNTPTLITRALTTGFSGPANVVVATIGGTITAGDTVSISISDSPSATVMYTVLSGDTTTSVAKGLAALMNANTNLQQIGFMAAASGPTVVMSSTTGNTFYSDSLSSGATETVFLGSHMQQTVTGTVGGPINTGDNIQIYVRTPGNFVYLNYTTASGNTATTIAAAFASLINANTTLQGYGITATSYGANIVLSSYATQWGNAAFGINSSPGETITLNQPIDATVQTKQAQYNSIGYPTQTIDPVGRTFSYAYATNNIDLQQITETRGTDDFQTGAWTYNSQHRPLTHTDGSGQVTHYTYNSSGQLLTVTDANSDVTTLTYTGTAPATIGGTITAGNVLTITVHDAGLSGGMKSDSYTVLAGDTLTTVATGLRNAINADASLSAIGVTATSSGAVVTLVSTSVNVTTYTDSKSGGSTETITLGENTFGFLTQINGPMPGNNDVTNLTYDSYNRVQTKTDSEGYILTYSYDNMNRPTQTLYPDGTTEQTIYNRLDAIFKKDRIGRWTQDSFDNIDRIAFEIDPLGRKTEYSWCYCGSLMALTDPNGHTTMWQHDLEGRVVQKTYQDQTTVNYTYDPYLGLLRTKTDALNQTTMYFYNNDGTAAVTGYRNVVNPTSSVANTWDTAYNRLTSLSKDDWGTLSYTYNPYIVPAGTPTTGGGMLASVTNNVIANSTITYTYDVLGRTTNRSINGSANSDTWTYDQMSRVTAESNVLGSFGYNYVDNVSGSSRGTLRLSSINYPNSQTSNFSWYGNTGDQRLQQITNLNPSGALLSQFIYGYDSAGEITQWQQQQNGSNLCYSLGYDLAGQLTNASAGSGSFQSPPANEYHYSYDPGANRTAVQTSSLQTLRLGGTKTTGDVLTLTVNDSGLAGGTTSVSYTVLAGDTLATAAQGLATAVNSSPNLQTLGVIANAHGSNTYINIRSVSPNISTYATSTNVGATETLKFGIFKNGVENASIGGSKTTGDTVTITVLDPALSGGQTSVTYTVLSSDTLATIASGIKNAINASSALSTLGVTATSASAVVSINSTSTNFTSYTSSTSSGATEAVALSLNSNLNTIAIVGGTITSANTITLNVYDPALSGGTTSVGYTTTSTDTPTTVASALTAAINASTNLTNIGVSASSSAAQITIHSNSINNTTYRQAYSPSTATESLSLTTTANSGWQVAAIGGTKTTGNVLTITASDSALSGGKESVSYTVLAADTLSTIAAGLAAAINADSNLSAIGVTAVSSGTIVSIESLSPNLTTYSQSKTSGATETIALGQTIGVTQAAFNDVNELVSLAPGGATAFQGTTDKPIKSATLSSQVLSIQATAPSSSTFATSATSTPGESFTFANGLAGFLYGSSVTATLSGTLKVGDTINLTFYEARLPSGVYTVSYVVQTGDTISSVISNLLSAINASSLNHVYSIYVYNSNSTTLFIGDTTQNPTGQNSLAMSASFVGAATETLTSSTNSDQNLNLTLGGAATAGDVVSVTVSNANLAGGEETASYTVASGNTLTNVASGLASAINADTKLQAIGVGASSASATVTVTTDTSYTQAVSGSATETITLGTNNRGNITATLGGAPMTGDVLTITAHNQSLSGGSAAANYTVLSSDTLLTIANGLAAAVNAVTSLQTLGVSAPANIATQTSSQSFTGTSALPAGAGAASVTTIDGSNNTKTNNYQVSAAGTPSTALTYDANGNMTSDGTNAYSWDADNRLIKIIYPGTGNNSQFTYDGLGRMIKIVETLSGSITSTKQFVWAKDVIGDVLAEECNSSGSVTKQFFKLGENVSSTTYFYTRDHLESTNEITISSGSIQAQYKYDLYGRIAELQGTFQSDFQYAGYYFHQSSGLNLALHRAYSSDLGRWIKRDPVGDMSERRSTTMLAEVASGPNLYAYVRNSVIANTDPSGLCDCENAPPEPSDSPVCDDYTDETYLGAYESCFCKCAGDSSWAQKVRGCLSCHHQQDNGGQPQNSQQQIAAHAACYTAAGVINNQYPLLITCQAKCSGSSNYLRLFRLGPWLIGLN